MAYLAILIVPYGLWRIVKNYKKGLGYKDEIILLVISLVGIALYFIFSPSLTSDLSLIGIITTLCWYLIRRSGWKRPGTEEMEDKEKDNK